MRSSQLIQRAVELLQPDYPTITISEIKKSLTLAQLVEGEVETKIVRADYISNDPIKTQKVLTAIQKVYQDYNLEQQKLRLTDGLSFINEQLPNANEGVNQAERALEQFRENQNLIDPEEQAKAAAEVLNSIEQEQQTLRAQYQETQARYKALQQQLNRAPQEALTSSRLSQSSRYQTLLNELQKTELALAQRRVRYTDNDQSVQSLSEQRQSQRALLQKELERILGAGAAQQVLSGEDLLKEGQLGETDLNLASQLIEAETTLLSLEARQQSLTKTEQQLREEIDRFPALIGEYNRLQPEVTVKRDTLQQLLKARQELGIEIARGGLTGRLSRPLNPVSKPDLIHAKISY